MKSVTMKSILLAIILGVTVDCRSDFKPQSELLGTPGPDWFTFEDGSQLPHRASNMEDEYDDYEDYEEDNKENRDTLGLENTNPYRVAAGELYQGDKLLTGDQKYRLKTRKPIQLEDNRWNDGPDVYPPGPRIFSEVAASELYQGDMPLNEDQRTASKADAPVCGGEYNLSSGRIRHPAGGGNYGNNENCNWIIRTEDRINITFISFDTQAKVDYLQVNNVYSSGPRMIWPKHSGSDIPSNVFTRTNTALLQWYSDNSITSTGFEINWEPLGTKQCGGEFKSSSGTIKYPEYPTNYEESELCIWIIRSIVPIDIFFEKFYIYGDDNYLNIRDGEGIGSTLWGNFSGHILPRPVKIRTNIAYITLKPTARFSRSRFELQWQPAGFRPSPAPPCPTAKRNCDFYKCGPSSGTIRNTSDGGRYNDWWTIATNSPIRIRFLSLNLLNKDYIYIKDSSSYVYQMLGEFRGSDIPEPIVSLNGVAIIVFISRTKGSSFELEWEPLGC